MIKLRKVHRERFGVQAMEARQEIASQRPFTDIW